MIPRINIHVSVYSSSSRINGYPNDPTTIEIAEKIMTMPIIETRVRGTNNSSHRRNKGIALKNLHAPD